MVFDTGVLQAPRAVPWECQLSATIKLCCLIDLKIAPSSWWILVVDKIAQTMDGFKDTNKAQWSRSPRKALKRVLDTWISVDENPIAPVAATDQALEELLDLSTNQPYLSLSCCLSDPRRQVHIVSQCYEPGMGARCCLSR